MDKIKFIWFSLILVSFTSIYSQSSWHVLPNAPVAEINVTRFDDTYFINAMTGWIVEGTASSSDTGRVFKTTDGGHNWVLSNHSIRHYLRSTGFFDANIGINGTIEENQVHKLYRTIDGGFNWTDITQNIQGAIPFGICGISIVNSTTAFASGRYSCPANVIKIHPLFVQLLIVTSGQRIQGLLLVGILQSTTTAPGIPLY
jgi:hypothetical protein